MDVSDNPGTVHRSDGADRCASGASFPETYHLPRTAPMLPGQRSLHRARTASRSRRRYGSAPATCSTASLAPARRRSSTGKGRRIQTAVTIFAVLPVGLRTHEQKNTIKETATGGGKTMGKPLDILKYAVPGVDYRSTNSVTSIVPGKNNVGKYARSIVSACQPRFASDHPVDSGGPGRARRGSPRQHRRSDSLEPVSWPSGP